MKDYWINIDAATRYHLTNDEVEIVKKLLRMLFDEYKIMYSVTFTEVPESI